MRRVTVLAVVAGLVVGATLAAPATSYEHIKDRFSSIGWGGSDGSLPWAQNWVEINDDGDEKFGEVRVVSSGNCADGNCIQIMKGLIDSNLGVKRKADTSFLEELSLCYDINNVDAGIDLGMVHLLVQVKDGDEWATLADYDLGESFSGHFTHEGLDEYRSRNFQVRFLVTGPLLASEVYIDNVEIRGIPGEETTTTTTLGDGTTTTTVADATTSTTAPRPTTTTTKPESTTTTTESVTTTTAVATTSSTLHGPDRSTTPGGPATSTSTTIPVAALDDPGSGDGTGTGVGIGPEGSGIRAAARGLQASFQGDLYGDMRTVSAISGVDLQADYNMAVEVIRATWAWVVVLGLLIAWAIVSGLDHRREDIDG